uniref:Protein draper-like n=1 Tax=Crassostrea virginica TaxID=6565 RepID=A0A8B8AU22_CRAVI|nr:protein draper-like [Crassostrea virginica]
MWSLKQEKCISCMDGYYGVNCSTPCPVDYYGHNCISKCDCSNEYCHHEHGCRVTLSSTEELAAQLSLSTSKDPMKSPSSEQVLVLSTISTKVTKIPKPRKCPERRKQKGSLASTAFVICACLISTSASFLIVYIGLHCYMIRHKPAQVSSSVTIV